MAGFSFYFGVMVNQGSYPVVNYFIQNIANNPANALKWTYYGFMIFGAFIVIVAFLCFLTGFCNTKCFSFPVSNFTYSSSFVHLYCFLLSGHYLEVFKLRNTYLMRLKRFVLLLLGVNGSLSIISFWMLISSFVLTIVHVILHIHLYLLSILQWCFKMEELIKSQTVLQSTWISTWPQTNKRTFYLWLEW